jgi:hypothetical protein
MPHCMEGAGVPVHDFFSGNKTLSQTHFRPREFKRYARTRNLEVQHFVFLENEALFLETKGPLP